MSDSVTDRVARLLETADDRVDTVADAIEVVETVRTEIENADAAFEQADEDLYDLRDVADEAEDLLSTVDLTGLASTIDAEDLPDAVSPEDVPEAIRAGDPGEAVDSRELFDLADLDEVWNEVDVREFWREKRQLSAAIDDLLESGEPDERGASDRGVRADDIDTEALETKAQTQVDEAVRSFREGILAAHERLADELEANEESGVDDPSGRNPSAFSTMPSARTTPGTATRHSTVPTETRYSTAPNHGRVYGGRFDSTEAHDE